ncbi:hypothetical protein FE249_04020 [Acidiphilium multivorum]|uniref:TOP6B-like family protein n=1 Tax=Acidiphilium multivorum TaxID=62140 RepID=UPI001F4C4996|nr:TOP6B-like family protein [Acidiphilium multivorum]UNC13456.1 hypothetical protein FE249_04020 [Acidiphilium multivorum]
METRGVIVTFLRIVDALYGAIARAGRRGAFGPDRDLAAAIALRIARLAGRIADLAARLEAGTLHPPRRQAPRRSAPRPRAPSALPRRRGLAAAGGFEIRGYASQLAHLLNQPEMAAILAADPRFGRAVRPLCHLLRIPLPAALAPQPILLRRPEPASGTPSQRPRNHSSAPAADRAAPSPPLAVALRPSG